VLHVRLNRPPVNAIDQAMYQEMAALFADVDQVGTDVRPVKSRRAKNASVNTVRQASVSYNFASVFLPHVLNFKGRISGCTAGRDRQS
jgi:hypothetical protein